METVAAAASVAETEVGGRRSEAVQRTHCRLMGIYIPFCLVEQCGCGEIFAVGQIAFFVANRRIRVVEIALEKGGKALVAGICRVTEFQRLQPCAEMGNGLAHFLCLDGREYGRVVGHLLLHGGILHSEYVGGIGEIKGRGIGKGIPPVQGQVFGGLGGVLYQTGQLDLGERPLRQLRNGRSATGDQQGRREGIYQFVFHYFETNMEQIY